MLKNLSSKRVLLYLFLTTSFGWAMEKEAEKTEKILENQQESCIHEAGCDRNSLSSLQGEDRLTGLPYAIQAHILAHLDETSQENLRGTSHRWKERIPAILIQYRETHNYDPSMIVPWRDNPPLSPKTCFLLNTYFLRILGLYPAITHNNIKNFDNFFLSEIHSDQVYFEKLCEKIQSASFLPEGGLIKSYARLLNYHVRRRYTSLLELPSYQELDEVKNLEGLIEEKLPGKDAKINPQQFQNEIVLSLYHQKFIKNIFIESDQIFQEMKKNLNFDQVTCSLAGIIKNQERLSALRQVPGVAKYYRISSLLPTWREIIELDYGATARDLMAAAQAHLDDGQLREAARYLKMLLERQGYQRSKEEIIQQGLSMAKYTITANIYKGFLEALGDQASPEEFRNAGVAHERVLNYKKAASYYHTLIDKLGEEASVEDIRRAALAHTKARDFTRAAQLYYRLIDKLGEEASVEDIRRAAQAHTLAEDSARAAQLYHRLIDKLGEEASVEDIRRALTPKAACDSKRAAQLYRQLIEKLGDEASIEDIRRAALAHEESDDFTSAAQLYCQLMDKLGDHASALDLYHAASVLERVGMSEELHQYSKKARELLQKLGFGVKASEPAVASRGEALAHVKAGRYKEAAQIYQQLFNELGDKTTEADTRLAAIVNRKLGRYEEEATYLSLLLKRLGNNASEQDIRMTITAHFKIRNFQGLIQCCDHLLEKLGDKTPVEDLHLAAVACQRAGNFGKEAHYLRLLREREKALGGGQPSGATNSTANQ